MLAVCIWLCALAAILATAAVLCGQLMLGRRSRRTILISTLVLAAGYCLVGADLAQYLPGAGGGGAFLGSLILITLTATAVGMQFWASRSFVFDSPRYGRIAWLGLLLCLAVLATAAGWRFERSLGISIGSRMSGSMDVEPISGEALLTDRGRLVPVYRAKVDGDFLGLAEYSPDAYKNQRIEQAPDDMQSNCHGWVFAGGRYLLTGDGVEMILADNSYRTVAAPQPGDVVIYRDRSDQIVHTGLVRLALDNGTVLVESKWGIGGRYLHKPEEQFYSPTFAYYRKYGMKDLNSDVPHLVQSVRVLPDNIAPIEAGTALAGRSQSANPPVLDEESGYPMPVGEEYPLGAE